MLASGRRFFGEDRVLLRVFLALAAAAVAYALAYYFNPWRPGSIHGPEGWLGHWDQSLYRRAALALTQFDFSDKGLFYPPLFPWLGAPFVALWPQHLFFVPSLVCFAVFLLGVCYVGERFLGPVLTYSVLFLVLFFFPRVTLEQWVFPWSSSATGALASIMLLLFVRFEDSPRARALAESRDWISLAAFYSAYGAIFASRPYDVFALFPLAVVVFLRVILGAGGIRKRVLACLVIGASGMLLPALYLILNRYAFGRYFGGYFDIPSIAGNTFIFSPELLQRATSLWVDSRGLYLETGQSFSSYYLVFIPALVLCISAIFSGPLATRVIAFTAAAHFASYVPFSDLTPENLFNFKLVHYLKWSVVWISLIAALQLKRWLLPGDGRVRWKPVAAAALVCAAITSVRIDTPLAAPQHAGAVQGRTILFTLPAAQRIDVVDAVGFDGGFTPSGASEHAVMLDGTPLKGVGFVKVLRASWGTRFLFPQAPHARTLSIEFPQSAPLRESRSAAARTYRFTLGCVIPACVGRQP